MCPLGLCTIIIITMYYYYVLRTCDSSTSSAAAIFIPKHNLTQLNLPSHPHHVDSVTQFLHNDFGTISSTDLRDDAVGSGPCYCVDRRICGGSR